MDKENIFDTAKIQMTKDVGEVGMTEFSRAREWKEVTVQESYYPTRLEYLAGKIVVGLLTGKSEKSFSQAVLNSVKLAQDMEKLLDQAQS